MPETDSMRLGRGDSRALGVVAVGIGFPSEFVDREPSGTDSPAVADAIAWLRDSRPQAQNHWPALALALVAQIELLAELEGVGVFPDIFASNPPETAAREGGRAVNTLNFTTLQEPGSVKLRPIYNRTLDVIRHTMLREHPSNAPHATQSWPDYRPLISKLGAMLPSERRSFAEQVWQIGVLDQPAREIASVTSRTVRPFERVLREMPTSVENIRGGAILQALAYGYLRADSPNLILESYNVNTGSSRAGMLGDVSGFRGGEPELAAEVKDMHLTVENILHQLGDFFEDIQRAPNVTAVVICRDITDEARGIAEAYFDEVSESSNSGREASAPGVTILSLSDLVRRVVVWDVPKQEEALRGVEYYLARIQKSASAVAYVRNWIAALGAEAASG